MLRRVYILTLLVVGLTSVKAFGQITIVSLFNKTTNAPLNDLWAINLKTNGNIETKYLKLKITLSQSTSNTEIWNSEGPVFALDKADENYTYSSFTNVKSVFVNDSFKTSYESMRMIPDGNYTVCINLIDPEFDLVIATVCNSFTIQNINNTGKKNIFEKWGVALDGNIQIMTFNSWGSPDRPQYPHNYVQVYGSPTISLFNIPVQLNTLLNFPDYRFSPSSSRVSVNFDSEQYKNNIKKKAADYISEHYDIKKILPPGKRALVDEMKKIETIINNKDLLKDIDKYSMYENLEKILKDTLLTALSGYKTKLNTIIQDSIKKAEDLVKANPDTYMDMARDTVADMLHSNKKNKVADSLLVLQSKVDSLQGFIANKRAEIESLKKKKEYFDKMKKKYDDIKTTLKGIKGIDESKLDVLKNAGNILTDKASYDKFLKDENLLSTKDKILGSVKTLNVGKSVTNVSEYTLYNVPINGITTEIDPAKVYMLFSTGNVDNPINFNTGAKQGRSLTTTGIGYGKKESSHFYIYYLEGKDNGLDSITNANVNTLAGGNKVVSFAGKLSTKKDYLTAEFDIAGSQYLSSPGNNALVIAGEENNEPNRWLQNIFTQSSPNVNTSVGYAGKIKLSSKLFKGRTVIATTYKRVNSSFRTFGNPYLVRDISGVDLSITQNFFKKRVKATVIAKYNVTGLSDSQNLTRYTLHGGFNLVANFPRYPMVRISYIPNYQQLDSIQIQVNTFNFNTVYNFRTGKVKHTLSGNWLMQDAHSQFIKGNFNVNSFTVANTIQFKNSVNAGASYNHNITRSELMGNSVIKTLEANCGATFFKKIITKGGMSYNLAATQNKLGGFVEASVNIGKNLSFKARADRNVFTNYATDNTLIVKPSFNEWLLRTTLNILW